METIKVVLGICSVSAAMTLAGCATVRSDYNPYHTPSAQSAGLTYFLPTRMVKVVGTRAPVDAAALIKARDGKVAEGPAARTLAGELKSKRVQAEKEVAEFKPDPADPVGSAQTKAGLDEALKLAKIREAIAAKAAEDLNAAIARLTVDIAAAQSATGACVYTVKVELQAAQPDPHQRFVASLQHNPLRDDTATLKVSPAGLLSSANVVAVDRTGDIIVELAGAISALGGAGSGGVRSLVVVRPVQCGSLPAQFVHIFDPFDSMTPPAGGREAQFPALDTLNDRLMSNFIPFRVKMDARAVVQVANPRPFSGGASDFKAPAGALFYRSAAPVVLTIEQEVGVDSWYAVDAAIVMLPQAGPVSYIPMQSSAFVKTVDDVQFTDGMISSWSPDRPSEVVEVVRLPVKVLTAIISVPAQILSLRVDYSTKDKSLAESQLTQIKASESLRLLKSCLEDSVAAGESGVVCLQD